VLLGPGAAFASEAYPRNVLPGARAAGLGGAYVAVADDPAAAYVNPAGLADLRRSTFSLSASVFAAERTRVADGERRGGEPGTAEEVQLWAAPVASALVRDLTGDEEGATPQGAAFFVLQTDAEDLDRQLLLDGVSLGGGQVPLRHLAGRSHEAHRTTLFGLSWGVRPSSRLALGVAALGWYHTVVARTTVELDRETGGLPTDVTAQWARTELEVLSAGLRAGALYSPLRRLSLGLAVQSPNLRLYSDGRTQSERAGWGTAVPGGASLEQGSEEGLTAEHKLPLEVALGVAYGERGRWRVSAEGTWDAPVDAYRELDSALFGDRGLTVEKAQVWDVAVGAEVWPVDGLALRGGVFTQHSNVEAFDAGTFGATDPGPRLGAAVGAGVQTGRISLDLTLTYQRARGETVVAGPAGEETTARTAERLSAFVGAAYYLD
jgi:long-chain fatty acid transport protein